MKLEGDIESLPEALAGEVSVFLASSSSSSSSAAAAASSVGLAFLFWFIYEARRSRGESVGRVRHADYAVWKKAMRKRGIPCDACGDGLRAVSAGSREQQDELLQQDVTDRLQGG